MQSQAKTVDQYVAELPPERQAVVEELRQTFKRQLPKGFEEVMSYGMIGWVVPHKLYPAGYHCDPKLPLPFLAVASQKNFISVYHMGLYVDPAKLDWFKQAHAKASPKKLDMGKSCVRYKAGRRAGGAARRAGHQDEPAAVDPALRGPAPEPSLTPSSGPAAQMLYPGCVAKALSMTRLPRWRARSRMADVVRAGGIEPPQVQAPYIHAPS
jgi:hypothetical protein